MREELRRIGERIESYFATGGDPPFVLYQYRPKQEWDVRRDLGELRRWLESPPRRIGCAAVSLADLFWAALDDSGYFDELVDLERREREANDGAAVREVAEAVGEILREPPTLTDRVVEQVEGCEERTRSSCTGPGRSTPPIARPRCSTTCAVACPGRSPCFIRAPSSVSTVCGSWIGLRPPTAIGR